MNGSCDSGCHQGWMGDYCHEGYNVFLVNLYARQLNNSLINIKHKITFCWWIEHHTNVFGVDNLIFNIAVYMNNLKISFTTVCDNNMFGQGCANRCGHCRNAMHCSHVNGSCLNGCDAGYKGNYCKEGIYLM